MKTCGICKKSLSEQEMSEVILFINGQETSIKADTHVVDGNPAHPESLSGTGGAMVKETDRWEWRSRP